MKEESLILCYKKLCKICKAFRGWLNEYEPFATEPILSP